DHTPESFDEEFIPGYDAILMGALATLSSAEEKKLLRRIDWHLIPLLAVMYMLKSVDFTNVSWGIVLCCHAAVTNRQGLYVVRFFLGLFEAGLWPGILLQLCYWYRPDEVAPRIVLVTILGNFSTVISGVLAFAFNGVVAGGLSGWKWYSSPRRKTNCMLMMFLRLILTEGIFTVLLGIFTYFSLRDFPSTATWLSEKEKSFTQARLPSNSPRAAEANFNLRELITTLKNKRIWLFLFCWAFFTIGTTGLTFYQPTVISNLGFSSMGEAQLLNIPSAVFAVILTVAFDIFTDTGRIPQPAIPLGFMIVILACYGVLYAFPNNGGVYAATIVAGGFSTAWYTMMWPWRVQTTEGATGSAFAIAFANSYGQIGGAVGSHLFNSRFVPRYTTSFGIAMGFVGMAIIMNLITWGFTWRADVDTRNLKRIRLAAAKDNRAVLDDADIHAGEKKDSPASPQRRMSDSLKFIPFCFLLTNFLIATLPTLYTMAFARRLAIMPGGLGGLGSSIGQKLRQQGARIAILYAPFEAARRDELLRSGYGASGNLDGIHTYECDITSPDSVQAAFNSLEKQLIDPTSSSPSERVFPSILINTAGYVSLSDMEITPPEETLKHLTTNIYGPMLCSQAFARLYFAASKAAESSPSPPPPGRIVSISSQAAHAALHRHGAYCASKAGLLGLTRSMASEWAGRGITANTVSPTVAWTELGRKAWGEANIRRAFLASIPTGKFALPEEVADSVLFLCQVCFLGLVGYVSRSDLCNRILAA
ncbi:Glucose/ribitol dehydrogenase, partial [Penicillium cf. griseofulvum]